MDLSILIHVIRRSISILWYFLMVYVAIRFKKILNDVQTNAKQVVQLSEEKKEQAIRQQKILEEEVTRQTIELRTSLENLKSTQAQLIQSEKMASLDELQALHMRYKTH